ncbi:allantoinase [Cataglyphis hispanica]|uniref:allantoinase n=1 Tax=Cataglyphis hispanica TaxID=1086592 RepID=UPI00217FEC4B|nr:allantoinase [Cataglyphis hispanica]
MCSQENSFKVCAFVSQRTVFANSVRPATLVVSNEKIREILYDTGEDVTRYLSEKYLGIRFHDYGSLVLMPGIIDSHVHVNEPGRTEWEGFDTATRAAAAGGVTTIADMPLNSIPPTTTLDNLKVKATEARAKIFVDVAFWGGVIPGNQHELRSLVDAGVVGFKCFLCPSGVDEFPHVSVDDVEKTLMELLPTKTVLAFHAEYEQNERTNSLIDDPNLYDTFLHSRPDHMEVDAVKLICDWCTKYNFRCHIVHLSSAECLALINDVKARGAPLTVETCHHYLVLAAEEIPESSTEFKCCPPIRRKNNREQLWQGIKSGTLDMIVSDHSPCVPELKIRGNFLTAWGGISSLQFGLSLMWTAARTRDMSLSEISKLLSSQPARLCGLDDRKGNLSEGMDADFVIWHPEETIKIETSNIYHKNKLTPYQGKILFGKVIATVLRGQFIFREGKILEKPVGNLLLNANFLQAIETQ